MKTMIKRRKILMFGDGIISSEVRGNAENAIKKKKIEVNVEKADFRRSNGHYKSSAIC